MDWAVPVLLAQWASFHALPDWVPLQAPGFLLQSALVLPALTLGPAICLSLGSVHPTPISVLLLPSPLGRGWGTEAEARAELGRCLGGGHLKSPHWMGFGSASLWEPWKGWVQRGQGTDTALSAPVAGLLRENPRASLGSCSRGRGGGGGD